MRNRSRSFVIFFMVIVLIFTTFSPTAFAQGMDSDEEANAGEIIFDVMLIRPFGLLATTIGSVAFLVALPFAAMTGQTEDVYDKMVAAPAEFTFKRPIGDY
ncbi:hypothetical protein QUF76_15480 [Desulfobacterales bacterium HSG16]|nr:hypothetical protein [Desulfobacterales bacterium HSG16]